MSKIRTTALIATLPLSLLSMAATPAFENTDTLDRQVAAHLNADIGAVGGARAAIDSKLKLKTCPGRVRFSTTNTNAVLVRCPELGWRIFVPVRATESRSGGYNERVDEVVVQRNQPVTLVVNRPHFSVRYSMIAQRSGKLGDFIPVRSNRKAKTVMARIIAANEVELTQ